MEGYKVIIDPALTTISQPTLEMGKRAVELVIDQIEGNTINLDNKKLK